MEILISEQNSFSNSYEILCLYQLIYWKPLYKKTFMSVVLSFVMEMHVRKFILILKNKIDTKRIRYEFSEEKMLP